MSEENSGWVRDYRKILDWPWFKDPKTAHLWEYCRLKATYQARRALVGKVSVDLLPGQFVFGRRVAADETGMSEQEVRTAAKHLIREKCLNLTNHSTNLFSIATVCNWERYQGNGDETNQAPNQGLTKVQPGSNQGLTTDKKEKNIEEGEEGEETAFAADAADPVSETPKKPARKPKAKPDPKPPEPRPRNIWWDAICDIFGMKPVTKQDQSRLGKLSRDFKLKCEADGAAPDEIDARREVLSLRWSKNDEPAVVTPEALLKHWDSAKETREDPFDIRPVTPEEEAQMQAEVDAIPEADFIAQYHAWIAAAPVDKIRRINPRAVRLGLPIPVGLTLDKDGFVLDLVAQEGAAE